MKPGLPFMGSKFIVLCIIALLFGVLGCFDSKNTEPQKQVSQKSVIDSQSYSHDTTSLSIDSIQSDGIDSISNDSITLASLDSSILGIRNNYPMPSGRVVNVLITGIDARLGEKSARADANHLVRFFLDSGCIEIISIPRGTFCMIRKDDTSGVNIIANARSIFGQQRYIKEITNIAKVSSIDYFIEFGFSQAMGIIELLGYKDNAASTLRVLRSRKAFTTGDHQRSFNQGQFIRQAIIKVFDRTDDIMGKIGLRAALALTQTNLSYDASMFLLEELRKKGFSSSKPDRIWVRMKPNFLTQMQHLNFDSANVAILEENIDKKVRWMIPDSVRKTSGSYTRRLQSIVKRAAADSAKNPTKVIQALALPFEQKSWMQVKDKQERVIIRNRICALLISAFTRTKRGNDALVIQQYLQLEIEAYQ